MLEHAQTWSDVEWLRARTRLPLLLKGVLRADGARQAQSLGVAGPVVSNHGEPHAGQLGQHGWALPRGAAALGSALPLLMDSGIRRGTDVLKALVLGARAVLLGRPALFGLAVRGPRGVAKVLRLLRDEYEPALAPSGCATPQDASQALLAHSR